MSTGAPPLELDRLGWWQFDELCERLLEIVAGIGRDQWAGDHVTTERAAIVEAGLALPGLPALTAPTTVLTGWIAPNRDRAGLQSAAPLAPPGVRRTTLVLCNIERPDDEWAVVAGPQWISDQVDALPALRRALPSLLSLAPLERWVPEALRARSTLDVTAATALAEVFVPTSAYRRALGALDAHRFAVLTGPPEMGKTAIARMLALAALSVGVEAHECTTPEQVLALHHPGRRQLFVADDAFGSTEYRPDAAERWARAMESLLALLDDGHRLVMTSRPAPLHGALRRIRRERGAEWFPAPGAVVVDAAALDLDERALIVLRHGQGVDERARRRLRGHGYDIVCHPHFTPERMRRLVAESAGALALSEPAPRWDAIEAGLRRPTDGMVASLRALEPEPRALLTALLDAPVGAIEHRDVGHLARLHHPEGFSRSPSEIVEQLTGHFLRVTEAHKVEWVHPSWRDVLIDELRIDAPARAGFLQRCRLDGLLLALARGGGSAGSRELALLVDDRDWDRLSDRALEAVASAGEHDVARLMVAIEEAMHDDAGPDEVRTRHDRAELRALADGMLEAVDRRARRATVPVGPELLASWLHLAGEVGSVVPAAAVARTWTELLPAPDANLLEPVKLDGALRWLELVELLRTHAPADLDELGFPDGHRARLDGLVAGAESILAAGRVGALRPRLRHLLWLCVTLGGPSRSALQRFDTLISEGAPEGPEPEATMPDPNDRGVRFHVERVLADLV